MYCFSVSNVIVFWSVKSVVPEFVFTGRFPAMLRSLVFSLLVPPVFCALGGLVGRTQSAAVRGTLLCNGKPEVNVLVKLYDDDRGIILSRAYSLFLLFCSVSSIRLSILTSCAACLKYNF